MNIANKRARARQRRHDRVRKHVVGTQERPRLNVFRSDKHIYAQVIDDSIGHTIVSASTVDVALRSELGGKSKTEMAVAVGKLVAERALEAGVKSVVFDRGGFRYHGRIKALADAARETGLDF